MSPSGARGAAALAVAAIACAIHLGVAAHAPLAIFTGAAHDDALFIGLARHLSAGDWLGPYDQYTLAKGPGYAFFLALGSWLGLPLTVMHALFHQAAVAVVAWVAKRLSGSTALALAIFLLLLWHPGFFLAPRVVRGQIYPAQVLLCFALLAHALLGPCERGARLRWSAAAGGMLGWLWLTREEGLWVVPGILVLFGLVALRGGELLSRVAVPAAALAAPFLAILLGFQAANRIAYGQWVGVDFKASSFQAAVRALQGVRDGGPRPYVSVPRVARERIYAESPRFATLRDFFDPTGAPTPWQNGCEFQPSTCGDIGSGWFPWALRDAAARLGHYRSPARAARFFDGLAEEIDAACREGRLACDPGWLPYTPYLSWQQAASIPGRMLRVLDALTLRAEQAASSPRSRGTPEALERDLAFLNFPPAFPTPTDVLPRLILRGWYYESGDRWLGIDVADPDGRPVPLRIERRASPGLVRRMGDPEARHQRFRVEARCTGACLVSFHTSTGRIHRGRVDELETREEIAIATAILYLDEARSRSATTQQDPRRAASAALRAGVLGAYRTVLPPATGVAALGLALAAVLALRARGADDWLVLATTAWVLVASRAFLLALIDASAFPSLGATYLRPAYPLLALAVALSIGAGLAGLNRTRGAFASTP